MSKFKGIMLRLYDFCLRYEAFEPAIASSLTAALQNKTTGFTGPAEDILKAWRAMGDYFFNLVQYTSLYTDFVLQHPRIYTCPVYHTCGSPSKAIEDFYFASLNGYLTSSSFLIQICFLFFVTACSTHTCFACCFMNVLIYLGSQSSLATPRSLQHRINAFDLQPSVAVGMPSGEK
jgi:hypothetical protein